MDRNKKFITAVWLTRITGLFSILGSSAIVYMVISDRKNKLTKPSHRFLLLMSIFDIMQSSALAISSIAMPKNPDYPGTMGNDTTCVIQGFFATLGLAVPLYNSSLNLFFLLSIRYNIDPKIFSRNIEPYLHAFSTLVPLTLSIIFTVTGNMKPKVVACGPLSRKGFIFLSVLIIICILFCLYSMGGICWTVISQNKSMDKYVFKRINNQNTSLRSNKVTLSTNDRETLKQAVMYTCAFFLTYTSPLVAGVIWKGGTGKPVPYWNKILTSIFYPLQGFWNFLFYVRPGINYVLEATDKSFIGAVREVVFNGKALSIQRRSSPRTVSRKKASCRWSPTEASWQDKRGKISTSNCRRSPNTDMSPETKRTIMEGKLIDVENDTTAPEELILQESLNELVIQHSQRSDTRDSLHCSPEQDKKSISEGQFKSLEFESCVNNGHRPNVGNGGLVAIEQNEIQFSPRQQRRRSSFANLASVLCETDLEGLVFNSSESSN